MTRPRDSAAEIQFILVGIYFDDLQIRYRHGAITHVTRHSQALKGPLYATGSNGT